jgi:hypothetical protein
MAPSLEAYYRKRQPYFCADLHKWLKHSNFGTPLAMASTPVPAGGAGEINGQDPAMPGLATGV